MRKLSQSLIIHAIDDEKELANSNIGILNPLNGYKFALSCHILGQNNITPIFYYNQGAKVFKPSDTRTIWPKYFVNIHGRHQQEFFTDTYQEM